MNWAEQTILVTGGTGSFGMKFVEIMLREYHPKRLVIFSLDELKQHDMLAGGFDHASPRYFMGDVRDAARLERALAGITVVIHAAALKQVPACEYNPFEAIQTNIMGGRNGRFPLSSAGPQAAWKASRRSAWWRRSAT
jgi:UDP-N-acetylglucosamine 4,6-dehydratase